MPYCTIKNTINTLVVLQILCLLPEVRPKTTFYRLTNNTFSISDIVFVENKAQISDESTGHCPLNKLMGTCKNHHFEQKKCSVKIDIETVLFSALQLLCTIIIYFCKSDCILFFQVLEEINKWTFDVFKLHDITQGHPLLAVTYTILQVITLITYPSVSDYHKHSKNSWKKKSTTNNYLLLTNDLLTTTIGQTNNRQTELFYEQ